MAAQNRYLLTVNSDWLNDNIVDNENKVISWNDDKDHDLCVRMLDLHNYRLFRLEDIYPFINIRILLLSENFICDIEAVGVCKQLIKLDLHNNQIIMLPDAGFWADLIHLQILYLHDNCIRSVENLYRLSHCPGLSFLTLFDTPLSLQRNYRHDAVNIVSSLKALDDHVVSDEEIIEDVLFKGHFRKLSPSLKLEWRYSDKQPKTYADHQQLISSLLSQLNHILKHQSPVLIIQRYFRGYVIRKQFSGLRDGRLWAAVIIQRAYRRWKGLRNPYKSSVHRPVHLCTPATSELDSDLKTPYTAERLKLDYDSYLKTFRPLSMMTSQKSVSSNKQESKGQTSFRKIAALQLLDLDAAKLSKILESLQNSKLYIEDRGLSASKGAQLQAEKMNSLNRRSFKQRKIRKAKDFFGPMFEITTSADDEDFEADCGKTGFLLTGISKDISSMSRAVTAEQRINSGKLIRQADMKYHQKKDSEKPVLFKYEPVPSRKAERLNDLQMLHAGFECLYAVSTAYQERTKAENLQRKVRLVSDARRDKEDVRFRINRYFAQHRDATLCERENERQMIAESLSQQEEQHKEEIERQKQYNQLAVEMRLSKKRDLDFVNEFVARNTSVSKVVRKHNYLIISRNRQEQRHEFVDRIRSSNIMGRTLVRQYLERRQQSLQQDIASSRADIATSTLAQRHERLESARQRVESLKESRRHRSLRLPMICETVSQF